MRRLLAGIGLIIALGQAEAMPPAADGAQPPHTQMAVGEIHGTLLKDRTPQAGKQVVIQVQQDGQTLLTLPKTTGPKGEFVFKNIFRDPKYSYTLMAESDGKIYSKGPLKMGVSQEVMKLQFELTPQNEISMNEDQALPPESPRSGHTHEKMTGQWQQQELTSMILSAGVLVVLAYALGRYQRKK